MKVCVVTDVWSRLKCVRRLAEGCNDGLIVRIPDVGGPVAIALRVPGVDPIVMLCEGEACALGVQFQDQSPARATVLVTAGG